MPGEVKCFQETSTSKKNPDRKINNEGIKLPDKEVRKTIKRNITQSICLLKAKQNRNGWK